MKSAVIGLAGSASDGIAAAGEALISAFAQEGYFGTLSTNPGTRIRGGDVFCRVRVSPEPVLNSGGLLDLALVLNWEDFALLSGELSMGPETVLIFDRKAGGPPADQHFAGGKPSTAISAPLTEIAVHAGAPGQGLEGVILGLLSVWLRLPQKRILEAVGARHRSKNDPVLKDLQRAFAEATEYAKAHPLGRALALDPAKPSGGRRRVADGNEQCARAALFSGCKFFAGYPIAPASEILQYLQREIWKFGGSCLQAEDEIAAAAAAVGASYAGTKAMTATSGPGFSLQTEVLGLASAAELPLVCVDVQRGGPSTGMPTTQEQADLFAATFSCHGDSVRPVLAPTSVADTFDVTVEAFNIAEHYQTPVVVLTDRDLAQGKAVLEPIDPSQFRVESRLEPSKSELRHYARFQITDEGISPISHPGMRAPPAPLLGPARLRDRRGGHRGVHAKRLAPADPFGAEGLAVPHLRIHGRSQGFQAYALGVGHRALPDGFLSRARTVHSGRILLPAKARLGRARGLACGRHQRPGRRPGCGHDPDAPRRIADERAPWVRCPGRPVRVNRSGPLPQEPRTTSTETSVRPSVGAGTRLPGIFLPSITSDLTPLDLPLGLETFTV